MEQRTPGRVGLFCFCGLVLLTAAYAAAKELPMQALSRDVVERACSRVGGSAYGMRADVGAYGCVTPRGSVTCSADGGCVGYVPDLRPLPSNSIDAILGARARGVPIKIRPRDQRISPRVGP
jgi:hypothetical protein